MAKKLITALLTLTLIACSTISIYAAETTTDTDPQTNADGQLTQEEKEAEAKTEEKAKEKLKNGLAAYIRKINPNISKTKSKSMAGYFISKGEKYNLDPKVLMAIAQNESTFYTSATSPYGYKGLMQTSDSLARKYGYKPSSLYKANVSIEVGARYLSTMKKQFKTYTKAISAYAYGEGTVKSGNYSKALANKILKTRSSIATYLKKNNYV